jgi:DNA-binding transcriptional LysR family regulator
MQMDPRRLVLLRAVERFGGVTGAATALRVSPSAVSQQLLILEREAGVSLVDRSRRGGQRPVELTAAGRRLVLQADRLVQVLEDAAAELGIETTAGPVRIGAFFTVLRGFVGPALAALAGSHPALEPHIIELDEPESLIALRSGELDLAIVEDDAQRPMRQLRGLRYEALLDDPFRLVVPASWPDFDDLAELADRPWVDGPADAAVGQALVRLRRTTGLAFPAAHSCREFTAALAVVGAGLAGAFVPELALSVALLPSGIRVHSPAGVGSRRLGVFYRRSRHEPTPAVRAVLEALRAALP